MDKPILLAAIWVIGCEASKDTAEPSLAMYHTQCVAPLDGADCFAVYVQRKQVPYTEAPVALAKCNSARLIEADQPIKAADVLDVHCASEDGQWVIDFHVEGLLRIEASNDVLRSYGPGWLRVRASGAVAEAFPEAENGLVDFVISDASLWGEQVPEATFAACDPHAEGGQDCPNPPLPPQGDDVFQSQTTWDLGEGPGHLELSVTSVFRLPDVPVGCLGLNSRPVPCPP